MGEVQVPADALWGAQTARAVENFPVSGQPVPAGVVHALALLKAAAAEVNADLGVIDAERRGGHRRRGPRGRGRPARRPVPDRRLPDRLRHLDEHERQRGRQPARPPRQRARRPPQRRRQRGPVEQRHLPERPADRCDARRRRRPRARARAPRGGSGPQGGRVRRRRQGRPHPPDGRRPGDARAGVRWLPPPARARCRPRRARLAGHPRAPARRHRGRDRPQRRARIRRRRHRPGRQRVGHRLPGGREPLRGAVHPGRRRRAVRRPQGRRRRPDEDLQRPALDVVRTRAPASARSTCPTSSPGRASCPARSTPSSPRRR